MSIKPLVIRVNNENEFSEAKAATTDTTQPIPMFKIGGHQDIGESGAGIWECTPGKLQRHIAEAEFSYIIEGEGSFTTDKGEKIEFGPGDSLYFSPNTKGEWEIKTTVRKAYFIV